MKVMCIDNDKAPYVSVGQIYEVWKEVGSFYSLYNVPFYLVRKDRFVEAEEIVCQPSIDNLTPSAWDEAMKVEAEIIAARNPNREEERLRAGLRFRASAHECSKCGAPISPTKPCDYH